MEIAIAPCRPGFSILGWVMAFDALAERDVEDLLEEDSATRRDREPLVCAACGARVTSSRERVDVNGAHAHTCTNPHGLTFDLGCFGVAEGCRPLGEATEAWCWFPGYAWRICVCSQCDAHLGWSYEPATPRSGDTGFFGLIFDRLTRPS
jgi:hypothetical protein